MIGPGGGSVHDPGVQLPAPMWDRAVPQSDIGCRTCTSGGKKVKKHCLSVSGTVWFICRYCDGGVWAART